MDDELYPHGTRARYTIAGCRCRPCTEANTNYQKERRKGKRRTVPVVKVADHLTALIELYGVPIRVISEDLGIPRQTLERYKNGQRSTVPAAYAGLILTYDPRF